MDISLKIQKTAEWIRKKVHEAGANGAVVGVSGGIDSAVVACLNKIAFPDTSLGVIIKIKSSDKDMQDALEFTKACGINHIEVTLDKIHFDLLNTVKQNMISQGIWNEERMRITDANLRARLRMSTVYAIANNMNSLVVGTDNAAELYTGYFTKYGDGGVDILPLANLTKHEVYEWAKVLNVTDAILKKAPSADLWEGQTDENEMGTKYKYIDALLRGETIPESDLKIIERLHKNSEHKRHTPAEPPIF